LAVFDESLGLAVGKPLTANLVGGVMMRGGCGA